MPTDLVIFDCDGVLFHSDRANVAFYNEVFRRAGVPTLAADGEIAAHAMASADLFQHYFAHEPETLERVRAAAQATPYHPFFELMTPREGLLETLGVLRSEGRKVAMATNRSSTVDDLIVHFELGSYFDLAVGARGTIRSKPHPDMLLRCCEVLEVATARAVFVGDQPSDAESARRAGVRFVGIGPVAATSEHQVTELTAIPGLLRSLVD